MKGARIAMGNDNCIYGNYMKKLVLILIVFVLASCSNGVVIEYTVVKANEKNDDVKNDTITGIVISFRSPDPCLLTYDGFVYSVKGNWSQGGYAYASKPLPISNEEKVIKFEQRHVEDCKIGVYGTKVYPKEVRKKYSKELVKK